MPADVPQTIRVLIVEDSLVSRQLLAHILRSDPAIEVVGMAADGVEALHLLSQIKADIVMVDISMPRMCGFEVTRRLMESGRPVPVVIISASGERGRDRHRVSRSGGRCGGGGEQAAWARPRRARSRSTQTYCKRSRRCQR